MTEIIPQAAIDEYEAREDALNLPWRKPQQEYPNDLPPALVAFLEEL
jgi:hypothetical protein